MTSDEYSEWLAGLKPGDVVAVKYELAEPVKEVVRRVTKTTVVTDGPRFLRRTGMITPRSYRAVRLAPWTDKMDLARVRAIKLRRISEYDWSAVSDGTLDEIIRMLSEVTS